MRILRTVLACCVGLSSVACEDDESPSDPDDVAVQPDGLDASGASDQDGSSGPSHHFAATGPWRLEPDLSTVWALAADDVWVAGKSSAVRRWDGSAWQHHPLPWSSWIRGLWASGADDLWAVGSGAPAQRGPQGWLEHTIPGDSFLQAVSGTSPVDAWAVGTSQTVLHWQGETWSVEQLPFESPAVLADVIAFQGGEVVVVGYTEAHDASGKVLARGGGGWQVLLEEQASFRTAWGTGLEDLWVAAAEYHQEAPSPGPLGHRTAAGWEFTTPAPGHDLRGVTGTDAGEVWIWSAQGAILRRAGDSWEPVGWELDGQIADVAVLGPDAAWAVGDDGRVYRWGQGAWEQLAGAGPDLADVYGRSSDDVWAVGDNGAAAHWDGASWSVERFDREVDAAAVWVSSDGGVWVAGGAGAIQRRDGGTWSNSQSGTSADLGGLWGASSDDLWAVGTITEGWGASAPGAGVVLHRDAEGWSEDASVEWPDLRAVAGLGEVVWAVGAGDQAFRHTEAGWEPVPLGGSFVLLDVSVAASGLVAAVGRSADPMSELWSGVLLVREGQTWTVHSTGVTNDVTAVHADPAGGRILASGQGGVTWELVDGAWIEHVIDPSIARLAGLWGSGDQWWIVGDDGRIWLGQP